MLHYPTLAHQQQQALKKLSKPEPSTAVNHQSSTQTVGGITTLILTCGMCQQPNPRKWWLVHKCCPACNAKM